MFSQPIFICLAYASLSHVIKHTGKICDKNISNREKEKLRNRLFKMKGFSEIGLGKGIFISIKGHLRLTKERLGNPEGQREIKSPSSELIFDTIDST